MSRFWSPIVQTLSPYVPGEQPRIVDLIKLNTNESPFGPSPAAIEAMRAAAADTLRLYPDPQSLGLREALAARHGVRADQIFVGNGSDEVLAHAFAALLKHDKPLRFPDITYSFYPVYCGLFDIEAQIVPLDEAMRIRPADYAGGGGPVIIANPNAPTGAPLTRAEVLSIVEANPDVPVVIDEAYVDFGAESVVGDIATYPNLLVIHTMSKSRALAGLRVGYAFGDAALIEGLTRVKDSFNSYPVNRISEAGATASVQDEAWFQARREDVIAGRERMVGGLAQLGFDVLPSAANFIFAKHRSRGGADLAQALRERAILVRRFNAPRISDHLRITVGTPDQVERLLEALREILGD